MKDDDTMVQELVQSTGCDSKLATMLLDFTSGDLEGAKRIVRAVPKDIFTMKAKFITQITGYYGAFFFCYDEKEHNIVRVISVVTNEKEIGSIDLQQHWMLLAVPLLLQRPLQLQRAVEVVLHRPFSGGGHDDHLFQAGGGRLLHGVLDDWLVDERERLLRLRLGGREQPGAVAGGQDDRLAHAHGFGAPLVPLIRWPHSIRRG